MANYPSSQITSQHDPVDYGGTLVQDTKQQESLVQVLKGRLPIVKNAEHYTEGATPAIILHDPRRESKLGYKVSFTSLVDYHEH